MRDFSRFLGEGEGEALAPHLRARILAAVPDTVPDESCPVARPFSRPVFAWGAVASALLLCILLTPLFLNSGDKAIRDASLATAPTATRSEEKQAAKNVAAGSITTDDAMKTKSAASSDTAETAKSSDFAVEKPLQRQDVAASAPTSVVAGSAAPATPPKGQQTRASVLPVPAKSASEFQKSANVTEESNDRDAAKARAKRVAAPMSQALNSRLENKTDSTPQTPSLPVASGEQGAFPPAAYRSRNVIANQSNHMPAANAPRTMNVLPPVSMPRTTPVDVAGKLRPASVETRDILLLVENVEQARVRLEQVERYNDAAIVGTKNVVYGDGSQASMLTLDVPTAQIAALLAKLNALGERVPFSTMRAYGKASAVNSAVNLLNAQVNGAAHNREPVLPPQSDARNFERARMQANVNVTPDLPDAPERRVGQNRNLPLERTRLVIHLQEKSSKQ